MSRRVMVIDAGLTIRMELCEALAAAGLDTTPHADLSGALASVSWSDQAESHVVIVNPSLPDASGAAALTRLEDVGALIVLDEPIAGAPAKCVFLGRHPTTEAVVAAALTALGARRILVIDDSATYRGQIREALEAAGYLVDEAETGELGLAALMRSPPDAVIVDGVLPGIDGATVVRRIKADWSLRHLPCCLLTAAESERDEVRSLEAGADAHVRKSEDMGVILVRLAALLRHAPAPIEAPLPEILPKRLLAVDDSLTYLASLGEVLDGEGYEATLVASGEEALARLEHELFDAILLDLSMPGLSGTETCRIIKKDPRLREIPLVMLTARDDRDAMIEGINAGADDYIAKAADFEVLKARLRAQLRRKHFEDENRRIRERLVRREAEERYLKLVHSNIIGVVFGDLDGRVTDANDAFLRMIGRARHDLEHGALDLEQLTPSEWHARDRAATDELLSAGAATAYEKELVRADGSRLPVMLGHVLLEGSRTTVGFVLDRTEHKQAEARIKAYMSALEEANKELERARDEAERMSQAKSSFLANMSHELRTPLNAIIGFAELLHDGIVTPDMPEHRDFLGDILKSGLHLLQLINDILDLSKVEAGKLEFRPVPLSLTPLVSEVVAVLRPQATTKRIDVALDLDSAVESLTLDPSRLKQILFNFLSNALKFTEDQGRVVVRARAEGEHELRLEVEDSGVGIPEADLGRLFIDFQQLDLTAGKRHQGTGLGLALTRRLAEAQGGRVGVTSQVGRGSTFHAILPRHDRGTGRTRAFVGRESRDTHGGGT